MKSFISNNKLTFFVQLYILIQPLLDFFTSLMTRFLDSPLTIGIIFRISFVAFAGLYLLFLYKGPYKKTFSLSFVGIGLFGVVNILCNAYLYGFKNIFENTKMFFKAYYFIFVLLFLFAFYIGEKFTISNKTLATVFIIYSGSIFLSAITNTSFVTYNYGAGYCGWFYAGNEVGAIISCLAPIALIYAFDIKNLILKYAIFFLVVFSALYIGTKVPFIALIGAVGILFVLYFFKYILRKPASKGKNILQCLSLLLIIVVVFNINSPIKQNLSSFAHQPPSNFFDDQNNDSATNTTSDSINEDEDSPDSTPENDELDESNPNNNLSNPKFYEKLFNKANQLLSNRLIFAKPAFYAYGNASLTQKLFGMGYHFETVDGDVFIQHIEMDFVALFINYGILGLLIHVTVLGIFAVICIKRFFKKIKNILCMENEITYIYSILITLFVALLAGHTLVAPAVSIYLAVAIVNLYSQLANQKSDKTDTSQNI